MPTTGKRRVFLVLLAGWLAGCGAGTPRAGDDPWGPGKADSLTYDGTPQAVGLLRFLNDASTTFGVLDIEVALDRRAASSLIGHRDGPDAAWGTGDDDPFDTVAEVAGVPWVGPKSMEKLTAYAAVNGWVPTGDELLGVYDEVPFTVREARAVVELANTAEAEVLDEGIGLDRRAVDSILEARPIHAVEQLAGLYYVGKTALELLKRHACGREIGIVSDLDKTVIPAHDYDGGLPDKAYPGVAALYNTLEFFEDGAAGDMYYVTARTRERIEGIPAWLETHGLPAGPIEPGVDAFWAARQEKVDDIAAILDAHPDQPFVLFGDSSHVDPEVMHDVMELYPGRIRAGLIHLVNNPNPDRLEGLHPHHDHAEAAAILFGLGLIEEDQARGVMEAARQQGLEITEAGIQDLLDSHRP